jgi:hypothetical protein
VRDAAQGERLRARNRRAQQAERDLPNRQTMRIGILSAEQSLSWR